MSSEKAWRVLLGSVLLLLLSYLIYFIRYPMLQPFVPVEIIIAVSILTYLFVLVVALLLLKKDSKKALSRVFENKGSSMILVGLAFSLLYLGLSPLVGFLLGCTFRFSSFPSLRGFESYVVYSLPLAFALYLVDSVFASFTEEVAYRGYVQTRITGKYGYLIGIVVSSLFFSLQHINVFQVDWISQFIQGQLLHVVSFGVFAGYLFYRSGENIWSVVSFHVLSNVFAGSVPVIATCSFKYAYYVIEFVSFIIMILILKYLPLKNKGIAEQSISLLQKS